MPECCAGICHMMKRRTATLQCILPPYEKVIGGKFQLCERCTNLKFVLLHICGVSAPHSNNGQIITFSVMGSRLATAYNET